jgi:S-adenosylmethionine synthetase
MDHSITSEAVSKGHPDKIADQISDAVLDACLVQDPVSKVACETLVTDGLVFLAGEISTKAEIDPRAIVRKVICEAGYDDPATGFDYRSCGIAFSFHKQSPEITHAVKSHGAGDQGIMYGFACDETDELMPLPIVIAHQMLQMLDLPYLCPDAKSQATVEYKDGRPHRISTLVLSTQHKENVSLDTLRADLKEKVIQMTPKHLLDDKTEILINPAGPFTTGGPRADTGLTGRKIMVDTYGSGFPHGGGAFSGKDPSKVDRSGAYIARYVAKNIVAHNLARRCEIQLAYAIGVAKPVAVTLNTWGTGAKSDEVLLKMVLERVDFTLEGIIAKLDLLRPIYQKTATGGHFGRSDPGFTWEALDLL